MENSFGSWDGILFAVSGFLAFQFALGGLVSFSSKKSYLPIILFVNLSWFQWHSFGVISGTISQFPHLYLTNLPLTSLFGPLLYHFVSQFWIEKQTRIKLFEFIPFLVILILLSPFYILDSESKRLTMKNFTSVDIPWNIQGSILIINFWTIYYMVKTLVSLSSILTVDLFKRDLKLQILALLLLLTTLACFSGFTIFFLSPKGTILILARILALIIFLLFFMREKFPFFFHQVQVILLTEKKKKNSQLTNIDLLQLEKKVINSLTKEKLYANEEFGLSVWAKHLGISQHQLSEFLNSHLKKSFFQLVNQARIREAKELIVLDPKKSILNIAFEVGFPSKSTFYDSFRKETGMTPQEYRKNAKKNPEG